MSGVMGGVCECARARACYVGCLLTLSSNKQSWNLTPPLLAEVSEEHGFQELLEGGWIPA